MIVDEDKCYQWHKDINNGSIPFIETTDGRIIAESDIMVEYALNADSVNLSAILIVPADREIVKELLERL